MATTQLTINADQSFSLNGKLDIPQRSRGGRNAVIAGTQGRWATTQATVNGFPVTMQYVFIVPVEALQS